MKARTVLLLSVAIVLGIALALPARAAAQPGGYGGGRPPSKRSDPAPAAPRTPEPAKPDTTVEISVTREGFTPKDVTVKSGQRVRLRLRRTTDETCAREFVLDEFLVWKRLPLNETVTEEFVTGRAGDFTFKCPNGEASGILHVVE